MIYKYPIVSQVFNSLSKQSTALITAQLFQLL